MTPTDLHGFFATSATVAGALIGLLFVAITVAQEQLAKKDASQSHRVRASAALTAFTNALTVSLFALLRGQKVGPTAAVVAALGLVFVAASILSLVRVRRSQPGQLRDGVFLVGLAITFGAQLVFALRVIAHPHNAGDVDDLAVLVIVCFVIGIGRSWELIGGPSVGLRSELGTMLRSERSHDEAPSAEAPSADPPSSEA